MTSVRGAEDFHRLARDLHAAADRDLRREVAKGLREAARPIGEAMAHALGGAMPQRGGLGPAVSQAGVRIVPTSTGANPSVTVWLDSRQGWNLAAMEAGTLRHPTFGHRPLVSQRVPAGRATAAANAMILPLQANVERHVSKTLDKIGP